MRLLLVLAFLAWPRAVLHAQVTGDLRIEELQSDVFHNTRKLRVWLPPGYDDPANGERTYPVLYLNDGQNVFDAKTALFGPHEWRADETATDLVRRGTIPPLVIVGIDDAGRRGRAHEYLPWPDRYLEPPEPHPEGDRYGDFLAREVLPFVEARYRVSRDPAGRALGGSSYGALVALRVAELRPDLFTRLLLESPSFYVDDDHVLRALDPSTVGLDRVYLGVGTNELGLDACPEGNEGNTEAVYGVERAATLLARAGLQPASGLELTVEKCGEHGEAAWARRLPGALTFLFGGPPDRSSGR